MNPELPSPSALPALPVRRRETLEILDTALKLYRRYFWVLLGWSALVFSFALVPILNWFSFFTMPLLFGAVSCCVAAAVRGQGVKFSQCWAFTKPRYGPLLGTILLSYLILFGISIALFTTSMLLWLLVAWVLSIAPEPVQIVLTILAVVIGAVVFSVVGIVAFGWSNMVPIVVCLEDDKRSTAAIGRAFDLLKGNWRRVFGLFLILGLAIIAVFIIVGVIYGLFGLGALGGLTADSGDSAWLGLFATFSAFIGLFLLIWQPAQCLVIAVLYLDLRVRREALDLEWTAYASAPVPVSESNAVAIPPSNSVAESQPPVDDAVSASTIPTSFAAGRVENTTEASPDNLLPPGENEARRD